MIAGGEGAATARGRTAGLLLVVALALLVHARALGGAFLFDDERFIVDNAAIAEVGDPVRFFTDPSVQDPAHPADIYRPMRTLAFAVQRAVFGLQAGPFHAVQVLLHAACAALVYLLLVRLGLGAAASAAGAAIFAVHPAQVEAVAWIASLADVMAAFFALLAVHAWLRSRGPDRWYAAAIAAGLLASLSKETALVFPGFFLLVDLVRPDGGGPSRVRAGLGSYVLPFLLALGLALLVRSMLVDARDVGRLGHFEWWGGSIGTNLSTAARAAAFQGLFAVLPFRPSTEWYMQPARSVLDAAGILCGIGVVLVLALAARAALRGGPRARLAGVGVLFFALAGLMTSHLLFTVGISRTDRFLYLSLVGAALAFAAAGERVLRARPGAAAAVAGTAVLAMAAISWDRIGAFESEPRFWVEATDGLPGPRPECRSISEREDEATALLDGSRIAASAGAAGAPGDPAAAREAAKRARDLLLPLAAEVRAHNERWVPIFGGNVDGLMEERILVNLALAHLRGGDPAAALATMDRLRTLAPPRPGARHVEALILRALGRIQEAGWRIEESLEGGGPAASPTEAAEVLNEAAQFRLSRGLDGAALRALRRSASLVPDPRANAVVDQVPGIEAGIRAKRSALAEAFAARPGDFPAAAAHVLYEGRGGGPAEARAAFTKAFGASVPETAAVRVLWAMATMEADDREEGWRAAEAYHLGTLGSSPGDAGALLGVARCREALQDRPGALARWREVLALPGASPEARREAEEGLRRAGE